jgi:hypothetical protein
VRSAGGVVHLVGTEYLVPLAPAPPAQRLLGCPALALEQVLDCELLVLVPPHLQRTALAGVDQVVYRLVVDLDEGEVEPKTALALVAVRLPRNYSKHIPDRLGDYSLTLLSLPALNGIGLA